MEHEGELIWLRQSATFTVNGQTRTVEIAVPVRPDASAEEVEALMSQANIGMDALTHQLDTRIAELLAGEEEDATAANTAHIRAAAPVAAPVATPVTAAATPPPPAEPAPRGARPASTAPAPVAPAAAELPAEVPAPAARPAPSAPARPQAPQTAAQPSAPARAGASGPLRSQPPVAAQPQATPTPASSAPQKAAATPQAGPDISRAEFITATAEMGLNPAQAMERLGVRSLQGLNLREALEALRRQLVRDGGAGSAGAAPAAPPAQASRPAQPARAPSAPSATPAAPAAPPLASGQREAAQAQPPRYFEEEDELDGPEFTFSLDEEGDLYDEFGAVVSEEAAGYGAGGPNGVSDDFGTLDDLDELELDDVPDFGPPPTPARSAPRAPAPPAAPRRGTAQASAAPSEEASAPAAAMEGRSLGLQRVGQFRSVRGGGAPTGQQRMAYRNIIVRELGDGEARALVQGLWRVTPDRLGGEQLDALVNWGKRDIFAEEAAVVLAVLQEERERNDSAASAAVPSEAAPPQAAPRASGTAASAQRPAPRPRTTAARPTSQAGDL